MNAGAQMMAQEWFSINHVRNGTTLTVLMLVPLSYVVRYLGTVAFANLNSYIYTIPYFTVKYMLLFNKNS